MGLSFAAKCPSPADGRVAGSEESYSRGIGIKTLAVLSRRYRPGTPFTAQIHIRVSDHEVPADFPIVWINTKIPYHGRIAILGGRTCYIAALEPVHVRAGSAIRSSTSISPVP